VQFITEYIFCHKKLIDPLEEVQEIYSAIKAVKWSSEKVTAVSRTGKEVAWQEAYNRHLELAFEKIGGWQPAPVFSKKPMHKGSPLPSWNEEHEKRFWLRWVPFLLPRAVIE
jgi:hypothetical protein